MNVPVVSIPLSIPRHDKNPIMPKAQEVHFKISIHSASGFIIKGKHMTAQKQKDAYECLLAVTENTQWLCTVLIL